MKKTVILTGVSGVGKSSISERLATVVDEYEVVDHGDVFHAESKSRGFVEDRRDEMTFDQYYQVQRHVVETLAEEYRDEQLLLDSRCAIGGNNAFMPGLPKHVLTPLDPDIILLIDAPAEEVLRRRRGDGTKDRFLPSVEEMETYREVERTMAVTGAVLTGAYFKIIDNEADALGETVESIVELLPV